MNSRLSVLANFSPKSFRSVLAAGAFGLCLAVSNVAAAQVVVSFAPPTPAFIATSRPVYYEGHASYWYGNHWVYRDPHGWHRYEAEPAYLHGYRGHAPPARYHYEGHRR
jgi:hypothetical protein